MYNQQENILSIIDALQTIDFAVFHACLVKTLSKKISNSLKIDSSIELQKILIRLFKQPVATVRKPVYVNKSTY